MHPITIDFEASCLPRDGRSFPIEVGISDAKGEYRAWLIKPHANWVQWTWTREAERMHGISRERLELEGLAPDVVMHELNLAIGNGKLIADSDLDSLWLGTLSDATGIAPSFTIVHLGGVIDDLTPTDEQLIHAEEAVAALSFQRHRAADDARHLALWFTALTSSGDSPGQSRAA